jgi:hypothetical protein
MWKKDHSISLRSGPKPNLKPVEQDWRLRCIIQNTDSMFWVMVSGQKDISELKEHIHARVGPDMLKGISDVSLVILKVRNIFGSGIDRELLMLYQINMNLDLLPKNLLSSLATQEKIKSAEGLDERAIVSSVWKSPPLPNMLHVFVRLPAAGEEKLFLLGKEHHLEKLLSLSFCHSVVLQSLASFVLMSFMQLLLQLMMEAFALHLPSKLLQPQRLSSFKSSFAVGFS